jgi:hypothetical protein
MTIAIKHGANVVYGRTIAEAHRRDDTVAISHRDLRIRFTGHAARLYSLGAVQILDRAPHIGRSFPIDHRAATAIGGTGLAFERQPVAEPPDRHLDNAAHSFTAT